MRVKDNFLQIHSHQLLHRFLVPSFRNRFALHLGLFKEQKYIHKETIALSLYRVGVNLIYLSISLYVGLAELAYGFCVQGFGGQVVGHMICQVDQSDERSLKVTNPKVLHKSAVTQFIHIHQHKQNLKTDKLWSRSTKQLLQFQF